MPPATMYDCGAIFAAYLGRSTEKAIFVERLGSALAAEKRPLKILDVGAHDGAVTLRFLEAAGGAIAGSHVTAIDPSQDAIQRFKGRDLPRQISFDFQVATAENFEPAHSYDWIVISHSLYWSPDLKQVLGRLKRMGKKIVVVLREPKGIYQIQNGFSSALGNAEERLYTADAIASALSDLQIRFRRDRVISQIEIPEATDPAMKILVSFFLQTSPDKLSDTLVTQVRDLMKQDGDSFEHRVSFFWIGESESL